VRSEESASTKCRQSKNSGSDSFLHAKKRDEERIAGPPTGRRKQGLRGMCGKRNVTKRNQERSERSRKRGSDYKGGIHLGFYGKEVSSTNRGSRSVLRKSSGQTRTRRKKRSRPIKKEVLEDTQQKTNKNTTHKKKKKKNPKKKKQKGTPGAIGGERTKDKGKNEKKNAIGHRSR